MKIDATNSTSAMQSREHMTHFMRRRSVVALCCGLLTLALAFYGVTSGVDKTVSVLGENAFFSFIYYTMLSNTLAALSVAFVIPYAVEGILKMRFTLPRWIAVMYHLSATSIAIMMVFVLVFMSWASPETRSAAPIL